MPYWSAHSHSRESVQDSLAHIDRMVARAADYGQEALALTNHGNLGGVVTGYKESKKHGIKFVPGMEAYVAIDRHSSSRPATQHLGILAMTTKGYRNLVGLNNHMARSFRYKPIIDMADFAQFAEDGMLDGLAVTTGCWFGLIPTLLREGDPRSVRNIIASLDSWFGCGAYVEIQNHLIVDDTHDDNLHSQFLQAIADTMGMPTVITQDSHYVHELDRGAHETMKQLMSWSDDPDSAVFPGDGFHMVDDEWMRDHHPTKVYESGITGLDDLLSKYDLKIPSLDQFKLKVPDTTMGGNPDDELASRAVEELLVRQERGVFKASQIKAYTDRLDEELDVIIPTGFAGYLLFTAMVCDWMRSQRILFDVRGSASGSLTCWLLGISSLDPMKWGLSFDRFLSRDRTKPPDIDIDIEDVRRDEVMEYLQSRYVSYRIGAWAKMGVSVNDDHIDDETRSHKGRLIGMWETRQRRQGNDPDARITPDEMARLAELSTYEPYAQIGMHAAGLLIAPDEETMADVPLQWIASGKRFVTAFDKDDVEAMGLLKLDLLRLKTMTVLRSLRAYTGITYTEVPYNDRRTLALIGRGDLAGTFQLEGGSARTGLKRLKPRNVQDIIAAMALFRPATMDSGATDAYIRRRHGDEPVPSRNPILDKHTEKTYGVLLFQEQVIHVLRDLGMQADDLTKFLKAVKASNSAIGDAGTVIAGYQEQVRALAREKNFEDSDWEFLWSSITGFAAYGFNLAHSTSYGVLAYITAWYKTHHPVAFWASMLDAYVGDKKESMYLKAAAAEGIKIRQPHVNYSLVGYSADLKAKAIRKGLLSIKGVGESAAAELVDHAPYTSLADLATKVNARKVSGAKALRSNHSPAVCGGIIAALYEEGALEGIPE